MFDMDSMQTAIQRRNRKRMKRRRVVMRAALDQANAARGVYLRALDEGKTPEEALALHDAFVAASAEADLHEAEAFDADAEDVSAPIEPVEAEPAPPPPVAVSEPAPEAKKKAAKSVKAKKAKDEAPAPVAEVAAAADEPAPAPAPAKPEDHPDLAWLKDDEDDLPPE